jgi:hypothetical protein
MAFFFFRFFTQKNGHTLYPFSVSLTRSKRADSADLLWPMARHRFFIAEAKGVADGFPWLSWEKLLSRRV